VASVKPLLAVEQPAVDHPGEYRVGVEFEPFLQLGVAFLDGDALVEADDA
jgi:hypothetical protein